MSDSPFVPGTPDDIRNRFRSELELLTEVLATVDRLLARLDGLDMGGMPRVQFFMLFDSVKAFKTTQAIQKLFFAGFAQDAEMLLRVLVEQAVVVRWVHDDDSDSRVHAYALYLSERLYKLLRAAKDAMHDVEIPPELVQEIERDRANYRKLGRDRR